jgi:hypothetical protein
VLAEVGWNHTMSQHVALLRGAARIQNKTWGIMIGWKYTNPPYLDSGEEIYRQMVDAYEAGANYIMLFDYPQLEGNAYGVLEDEHFEALERFWNNVVKNPALPFGSKVAVAALVLPKDYGWGMRTVDDRIWGIWGPDEKSPVIWNLSQSLLAQYGFGLDIVYDDPSFPLENNYTRVYYWNQTVSP